MLELDFTQTLGTHCLQIRETLPASGITAVFGVSGAGKTSLINAISGLTRPQQGASSSTAECLMTLKNVSAWRRKTPHWLRFQDARLFPHYKVRGNLQYGMAKIWRRSLTSWWRCSALRRCLTACRAVSPAEKTAGGDWPGAAYRPGTAAAG
jgi:ABC-type molybdate transport system ATPase subunit